MGIGSILPITVSIERQLLDGFTTNVIAESRSTDIEGNEVITKTTLNRDAKTVTVSRTGECQCSTHEERMVNGLYTRLTTHDHLTYETTYDPLSRKKKELDSRKDPEGQPLATTFGYLPNTAIVRSVTDSSGKEVSFTQYNSSGRPDWTRNAEGRHTRFKYNARGQLTHQWGDAAYPVSFGYDLTYGDRTSMTTYQGGEAATTWNQADWPGSPPAGKTTSWVNDVATALLHKKIDAATNYVEFDYNQRGQISERYWSRLRPAGDARVRTSYLYDAATGELTNTNYNDGTANLTARYNRLGQIDQIDDGMIR